MLGTMKAATAEIRRWDVALAAVLSVLGIGLMMLNVSGIEEANPDVSLFAVPLFLAVTVPLAWRRVAPLGALAVSLVALLAHMALFHDVVLCGVAIPVLLLLLFAVAGRLDLSHALIGLALGLAGGVAVVFADPVLNGAADLPFVPGLMAVVWGAGRVVRSRARLTDDLQARTSELRSARDERAQLEVATDRARLSGELDELLQRRLGDLARLADGGPQPGDAAGTTATLVDIERESRQTLEEMRELVGVLREDSSNAAKTPQPTLTHLEALLVRAKGTTAGFTVEGSPRTLPAGVELSAYRVVEHLLAALDDSAEVDVRVRFTDEALELAVSGPSRRRAGAAIERARERVQLHHGTLKTSTNGRRYEAIASLPVLTGA
jgi:hypothetical protein